MATPRGGTPLYLLHRCVPPQMQRLWVLRRFGLKTGIVGIDFVYFSLNSGMVLEGMHYERIDRLIPNE